MLCFKNFDITKLFWYLKHEELAMKAFFGFAKSKQWPLAPNSPKWRITHANVSRRVTFFSKMANVECERMYRVRGKWLANVGGMYRVRGKWLANVGRMYRVRPKQVGKCRRKQDRSFYAQITYFICIKRSSLRSLNSPNSPNSLNSCKSRQTCLSRVWRVRAKWLANVGRMYRVRPIFQNGHFGEYSNSPKLANFWRVLEFHKFAGKWPLLSQKSTKVLQFYLYSSRHLLPHLDQQ